MAEKIRRAGIGFLPPPGFRLYFRPFDRCRTGISGSTFTQNSSDTSQDFICGILGHNPASKYCRLQHLFTDKLLVLVRRILRSGGAVRATLTAGSMLTTSGPAPAVVLLPHFLPLLSLFRSEDF